jgi:sugar lactone lactonase YvrE
MMFEFTLTVDDLDFLGKDLVRPECVLCTRNGAVFVADGRGGVVRIAPDGSQQAFLATDRKMLPNGIAVQADGTFLLADLGAGSETGGIVRLARDGTTTDVLTQVDGVDLPPSNYVLADAKGRVWLTVSTRLSPRYLGYRADADDGFIVLLDDGHARIVADGLGFTNEVQTDPSGDWLYVNETFGRRLSRLRIGDDGTLGPRETVTEFGHGVYPDGLTFDCEGGVWITSVVSNRIIRVAPDGSQHVVLEDCDDDFLDEVEAAYAADTMGQAQVSTVKSRVLRNISSLAFGGDDLKTVYVGNLLGDTLATFRSPIAGLVQAHWSFDI